MNPQPKTKIERNAKRLDFVRAMPCLLQFSVTDSGYVHRYVEAGDPSLRSDAHHIYNGVSGGVGIKPDDFRTLPLCDLAHEEFHRIGKESFEKRYGLDLESHIQRINAEYDTLFPAKEKRERKTSARVQHLLILCECGRVHRMPAGKVSLEVKGVQFFCPFLKRYERARFGAA